MFFLYISLIVYFVTIPFFASPFFNLFKPHKNDWTAERNNFKKLTADLNNFEKQCNDWLIQRSPENLKIIEAFLDYLDLGNQNLLENKPERYEKIKTLTDTMRNRLFQEGSTVYLQQLNGYLNGLDEFLKKEFPELPHINSYGLATVETLIKKEQERVKGEFGNLIQQKKFVHTELLNITSKIETQTLRRNELLAQQKQVQQKQKTLQSLENIKEDKDLNEQKEKENKKTVEQSSEYAKLKEILSTIEPLKNSMIKWNSDFIRDEILEADIENQLNEILTGLSEIISGFKKDINSFKNIRQKILSNGSETESFKTKELEKLKNIIQLKIKEKEEAIRTHASETDKLTPANLTQLKKLTQEDVTLGFRIDELEKELEKKQTEFQKQNEEYLRLQGLLTKMPQDTDYINITNDDQVIRAHNTYFQNTFKESIQFYSTLSLHIFLVRWALYKCVRLPKFNTEKGKNPLGTLQFNKSITRQLKEVKADAEKWVNTLISKPVHKTVMGEVTNVIDYYYDPGENLKKEFAELKENIFGSINSIIGQINKKIDPLPLLIQNSILSFNNDFKQLNAWFNRTEHFEQIDKPAKNAIVQPDTVSKLQQECIESFLKNMVDFIKVELQKELKAKNKQLQEELKALSVNSQTENPLIKSDQDFLKEIDPYQQNLIMIMYFQTEILEQYKAFFAKDADKNSVFNQTHTKLMQLGLESRSIQRGIVISYLNYFAKPLTPDEMPKPKNTTPEHQPVLKHIEQIAKDIALWQGIDCFKNIFPWICDEIVNNTNNTKKSLVNQQQINLAELQLKAHLESARSRINKLQGKSDNKLFQKFNELLLQKEEWQKTTDTCKQKRTEEVQ
ncbi:hypothetical protein IPH25_01555 [bacterium]|nr:MAG: hypothetical protein IPG37_03685 [bacterium]QQR62112.1 MAG: hypothetical protein IPH25_01555 [bacterium]QQR63330.1 MAG: hypothetical protein IPH67_02560 [bacterium]